MTKKTLSLLFLLIVAVIISVWFFDRPLPPSKDIGQKEYSSDKYGLAFTYSQKYFLTERELGNGEREHYEINLIEDTPENRRVLSGAESGREGPVSINLNVYQNIEDQEIEAWVKNTSDSNYKLSVDEQLDPTTMGGSPGLKYSWDGLYRGETRAIKRPQYIVAWSVTYLEEEDAIRNDFEDILRTIVWK